MSLLLVVLLKLKALLIGVNRLVTDILNGRGWLIVDGRFVVVLVSGLLSGLILGLDSRPETLAELLIDLLLLLLDSQLEIVQLLLQLLMLLLSVDLVSGQRREAGAGLATGLTG